MLTNGPVFHVVCIDDVNVSEMKASFEEAVQILDKEQINAAVAFKLNSTDSVQPLASRPPIAVSAFRREHLPEGWTIIG